MRLRFVRSPSNFGCPRTSERYVRQTLILAVATTALACGPGIPGATAPAGRNVITAEEISQHTVRDALELVQRIRPQWLRARQGDPMVYIDRVRSGGPDVLQTIALESIQQMRYVSPSDATVRYGSDHVGGAIEVTTKR